MIRRLLITALVIVGAAAAVSAARPATFVLANGERVSGMLTYKGGNEVTLNVNGQEREYPWSDIAIIAFSSGDPGEAELRQLPVGDNPPELERHTIVTQDGNVIRGKLYKFSPDGEWVTYDPREGGASETCQAARSRASISTRPVRAISMQACSNRLLRRSPWRRAAWRVAADSTSARTSRGPTPGSP